MGLTMKRIPYGISDYKTLINENYYYVDKTMYLEKLEDVSKTNAYLRPRRFGKTLFTSMMYYYYDINSIDDFDSLFKDTYVYNNPTPNKNNYYILKFDFSKMSSNDNSKEDIEEKFNKTVITCINDFLGMYNFDYKINEKETSAQVLANFIVYFKSLKLEHKIYIIIDEYDNFTNAILEKNNIELFKSLLGKNGFVKDFYATIKSYSGTVIDRTFVTGVCSISLDSMTSGFNIATNLTTRTNFNAMTSFTHDEVKELIKDYEDKEIIFKEMLENYDGYCFNKENIELVFNPTLTMYYLNYLEEEGVKPKELLDNNIISNYEQIRNIISLGDYKNIIRDIYDNGEIEAQLSVNLDLNNYTIERLEKKDIVSLLYYFGYLTIDRLGYMGTIFRIPNKVIREVFDNYFLQILKSVDVKIDNDEATNGLIEMAKTGKIDKISEVVSDVVD